MNAAPRIFKTRLRVRYSETDQMGVAYHANYLAWFEVGRVEMLRELGFAYQQLEAEEDCFLPVVEIACRYRAPARYDDQLELESRMTAMRGPVLKFSYRLFRIPAAGIANVLLAEADSTHVVVDRALVRRALPVRYAEAMRGIL